MNLSEFGSVLSPSDVGGSRSARASRGSNAYDDRSGAAMLRRTGKASANSAPLRGDPASALLAARRRGESDDRMGSQLRDFYRNLLSEPAPERLVALVEDLAAGRAR
jgi:hypothetical protein